MTQLIKLCLEKPDKFERMLLLLLKTLITVWILNTIVVYFFPCYFDEILNPENYSDLKFLSKFSPFQSALYIVFFILLWLILWGFVSLVFIPLVLGKIIRWIITIILSFPIFLFLIIFTSVKNIYFYFTKKNIIPNKLESEVSELFAKLSDQNRTKFFFGSLALFHFLNIISNSKGGSHLLYEIIENKKSSLVKSRIITYYSILIFLFIGVSFFLYSKWFNWIYFTIGCVLTFLSAFISLVNDIFEDLDNNILIDLKNRLEADIYVDMVDDVLQKHEITSLFEFEPYRKKMVLMKRYDRDYFLCDFPRKKINIYRFSPDEEILTLDPQIKRLENRTSENEKHIFICDVIPDIPLKNFLAKNEMFFIYAEDDEEVHIGLNHVMKNLKMWIHPNLDELFDKSMFS